MGYYMTVQSESLKVNGLTELPENMEYFEVDGEWVRPTDWHFKWTDDFEKELVLLVRAGVTGKIELMGEQGEYTRYVLEQNIVKVYEGQVVYPETYTVLGGEDEEAA